MLADMYLGGSDSVCVLQALVTAVLGQVRSKRIGDSHHEAPGPLRVRVTCFVGLS